MCIICNYYITLKFRFRQRSIWKWIQFSRSLTNMTVCIYLFILPNNDCHLSREFWQVVYLQPGNILTVNLQWSSRLLPNRSLVAIGAYDHPEWVPKTYNILGPTSGEQTTKFPAHSALLKQKCKTFGRQP